MRNCPLCASSYGDGEVTCERDGRTLVDAPPGTAQEPPDAGGAGFSGASVASREDVVGAATTIAAIPASAVATTTVAAIPASAGAATAVAAIPASASEGFDSLVGATLAGRYVIVRRIGEGGMGAVYEAKHAIIGKRVAVKVLLEKFLTKSDFVARLLQEARLASAIGHEHIVDVTDFGTTDDGRAFVVMEFLDGEALSQLVMREAPLPVDRALRIARQVASALGAAHAKGIVHRDVKPENVYLIQRGDADFVKVVDFGISKAVKQGQSDDGPDYRLTHTGLLLGTPLYMSPEQARGEEDLDQRVDVWALGVLLYECLTGEVPFRANNYLGIISQVLTHEAVPPSRLRPELGISEAVESVVMRAMEKDRARRYATMADVEADLDRLLAGDQNVGTGAGLASTTQPPTGNPARGRAWVWGAAVAALVGGVAMALARPESSAAMNAAPVVRAKDPVTQMSPAIVTPPRSQPTITAKVTESAPLGGGRGAKGETTSLRTGKRVAREKAERQTSPSPRSRPAAETARPRTSTSPLPPRRTEDVLRGALPSRSGEGYPDPP